MQPTPFNFPSSTPLWSNLPPQPQPPTIVEGAGVFAAVRDADSGEQMDLAEANSRLEASIPPLFHHLNQTRKRSIDELGEEKGDLSQRSVKVISCKKNYSEEQKWLEIIQQLSAAKDYERIVEVAKKAISDYPNNCFFFLELATAYWFQGLTQQAVKCAEHACTLSTHFRPAFLLASFHYKLYHFEAMLPCLQRSLEFNKDRLDLHFLLGLAYYKLGKFAEARGYLGKEDLDIEMCLKELAFSEEDKNALRLLAKGSYLHMESMPESIPESMPGSMPMSFI